MDGKIGKEDWEDRGKITVRKEQRLRENFREKQEEAPAKERKRRKGLRLRERKTGGCVWELEKNRTKKIGGRSAEEKKTEIRKNGGRRGKHRAAAAHSRYHFTDSTVAASRFSLKQKRGKLFSFFL